MTPRNFSQSYRFYVTVVNFQFEHATIATMGMHKLLSRLVDPGTKKSKVSCHCINKKPLVQFALLLATLIGARDQKGELNDDIEKQTTRMVDFSNNQSIGGQNALNMAWRTLMDPKFEELRQCIYATKEEFLEFRSVLFHAVLSKDVSNLPLNLIIRKRWEIAFDLAVPEEEKVHDEKKTTAVIEHLIQAAELSHYMQHWHVYCKWSQMLLLERRQAFQTSQSETDPSLDWYETELSLFDNQVIPLARKLKDSGLIGTSGHMYMQNAVRNRDDWAKKGAAFIAGIMQEIE